MWAHFLQTYLLGPVVALLPRRWRKTLPGAGRVQWERSATISGILEIAAALVALGYWYMYALTPVVSRGMELAVNGKLGPAVTEQQIGGAALILFLSHPLTWILAFFFLEGAVRMCGAAFAENVLGTMPLYLLERASFLAKNGRWMRSGDVAQQNVNILMKSMRERLLEAKLEEVTDELHYTRNGEEEMLELRASRRKEEWAPPKIVRVDELYYRLEEVSVEKGARPFRYRLRRLDAGVPGRNVILYGRGVAIVKE